MEGIPAQPSWEGHFSRPTMWRFNFKMRLLVWSSSWGLTAHPHPGQSEIELTYVTCNTYALYTFLETPQKSLKDSIMVIHTSPGQNWGAEVSWAKLGSHRASEGSSLRRPQGGHTPVYLVLGPTACLTLSLYTCTCTHHRHEPLSVSCF